jgi:exonuclease SbcC
MIDRLHKLRVKGFRPFLGDTGPVPLDADVVLVYGPNGAGKTGLMSAIECALTGAVTHLECFEDDYPRCLRNTEHAQKAELWLEYLDNEKKLHKHQIAIQPEGDKDRVVHVCPVLAPQDAALFSDRCYLSQHRLSRLLEIYQASPKGTEQHLVRFARELLGLEVLENLITGLYVVKDERRLRNALPPLDELQHQASIVANRVEKLQGDIQLREHERRAAIAALEQLSPNANGEGLAQLEEQITLISGEQAKNRLSDRRQRLQQQCGQLEGSVGFLGALPLSDYELSKSFPAAVQDIGQKISEIRTSLSETLNAIVQQLRTFGFAESDTLNGPDIDGRFRMVRSEVRRLTSVLEDEIAQRSAAIVEVDRGQNDLTLANTELQLLAVASGDHAAASQKRVELLQTALECIGDNTCPVCSRDYSEVASSRLIDHLKEELAKIGLTISQIESQGRRRLSLESTRDSAAKQIAAANLRLANGARRYSDPEAIMLMLRVADLGLKKAAVDHASLIQLCEEEATLQGKMRTAQIRDKQYVAGLNSVKDLATQLSIEFPADIHPPALYQLVRETLGLQIADLETELGRGKALITAYTAAASATKVLAEVRQVFIAAKNDLLRIRAAEKASSEARTSARAVEKAAQTVKARLIKEVFNDKLNALCQALYRRLVRVEAFDPSLSEPRAVRGTIKAGVQAMLRKRQMSIPFQDLASVVSASNLNTAALSLFLSLNLVQNPKHRILLLDDPVQSMDDVHVVQLAGLLRSLVRETNRQLIVAVHERAMFDYLALELGPTRIGDTLITLELSREPDGSNTTVKADRKSWKTDSVSFGGMKLPNVAG